MSSFLPGLDGPDPNTGPNPERDRYEDETQLIPHPESPEQFREKWSNRFTAWTMTTLVGGGLLLVAGVIIRIFRWVSGI